MRRFIENKYACTLKYHPACHNAQSENVSFKFVRFKPRRKIFKIKVKRSVSHGPQYFI
jgi:hypothetical protein